MQVACVRGLNKTRYKFYNSKFQMPLVCKTEEPVMRATCTERAQLRLFSRMTNWSCFEVQEVPWFLRSLKLTATDIHRQLVEVTCVQTNCAPRLHLAGAI
jgi:hypothetical protein